MSAYSWAVNGWLERRIPWLRYEGWRRHEGGGVSEEDIVIGDAILAFVIVPVGLVVAGTVVLLALAAALNWS